MTMVVVSSISLGLSFMPCACRNRCLNSCLKPTPNGIQRSIVDLCRYYTCVVVMGFDSTIASLDTTPFHAQPKIAHIAWAALAPFAITFGYCKYKVNASFVQGRGVIRPNEVSSWASKPT